MFRLPILLATFSILSCVTQIIASENPSATGPFASLPQAGHGGGGRHRGEVILHATVQHPVGKPCIDDFGERIQAFVGCATAAGGEAKMAGYFVFLVDVPTETVYEALLQLGAKPQVHYSIQEGHRHSGLKPETTPRITCRVIRWFCPCSGRNRATGLSGPTSRSLRNESW